MRLKLERIDKRLTRRTGLILIKLSKEELAPQKDPKESSAQVNPPPTAASSARP